LRVARHIGQDFLKDPEHGRRFSCCISSGYMVVLWPGRILISDSAFLRISIGAMESFRFLAIPFPQCTDRQWCDRSARYLH
jgi:hypothetical protein